MLLLILKRVKIFAPRIQIYIPLCFYLYRKERQMAATFDEFTFHYASTYTSPIICLLYFSGIYIPLCFYLYLEEECAEIEEWDLHSTMLLLILSATTVFPGPIIIYIPLCFYLYCWAVCRCDFSALIYIPLCFYLYWSPLPKEAVEIDLHSTMLLLIR